MAHGSRPGGVAWAERGRTAWRVGLAALGITAVSWLLANPTLSLSAKLGLLGSVVVVVAVWLHPPAAGLVLLGLLPFSGVSISEGAGFLRWVTVIVIAAWFLSIALVKPADSLRIERMDLWILAFTGLSVLSALTLNPDAATHLVPTYGANFASYFVISRSVQGTRDARLAVLALCIGMGLAAGIALVVPGAAAVREGNGIIRLGAVGASGDPSAGVDRFGGELIFAVALPWIALRKANLASAVARVASALAFLALVSTVSRGAAVALLTVLVAWALVFPSSSRVARVAVATALLLLGLAFLPLGLRTRFEQLRTGQPEALSRLAIWQGGMRMFWDHPLIGVGVGNFPDLLPRYLHSQELSQTQQDAHSVFVATLAETGIIGFAALLGVMVGLLYEATAWRRQRGPAEPRAPPPGESDEWRRIMAGLLVTFLGFLVVAATLDLSRDRFLFAVAGLIHGTYRMQRERADA